MRLRGFHVATAVLVLVGALSPILGAQPPWSIAPGEAGLLTIGVVGGVATGRLARRGRLGLAGALDAVADAVLSTAILAIAVPYLPDVGLITSLVFVCVLIHSFRTSHSARFTAGVVALSVTGFTVVFLQTDPSAPRERVDLAIATLALCIVGGVSYAAARAARQQIGAKVAAVEALASTSQRLGLALDVEEVTAAVLEACRSIYPGVDSGALALVDASTGALDVVPRVLTARGFDRAESAAAFLLGTGVADRALARGETTVWTLGERRYRAERDQSRRLTSAIATPLRAPGVQSLGVLVLGSTRQGEPWASADVNVISGLAEAAALALVRTQVYREQREHALTDALTGVRNRRAFEASLEALPPRPFGVLAIDVDHLKAVNDEYGHEAGDALLRATAEVIVSGLRPGGVLARVGGDEFAALLIDVDDFAAASVAERMRRAAHGVALPWGQARVSIGFATGKPGADPRQVWQRADAALYHAKEEGRDQVAAAKTDPIDLRARWEELIRIIVESRAMRSVYQPVVRLADRRAVGYEALARPVGSPPEASVQQLFTKAQQLGLGRDLDWLSRRSALDGARRLPAHLPLFLNVSAPVLLDPIHDVDQLLLMLSWAGRRPTDVVLEITEREAIHDARRLRAVLASYREHGLRFALDDVGEGALTFELLTTAEPEFIKIAASLVQSLDARPARGAVQALASFARETGAQLIAEGIETEATAAAVARLGISLGQGFLLGRPSEVAPLVAPAASGTVAEVVRPHRPAQPGGAAGPRAPAGDPRAPLSLPRPG